MNLPLSLQALSAPEGCCSDADPSPVGYSAGFLSSNRAKDVGLLLCERLAVPQLEESPLWLLAGLC